MGLHTDEVGEEVASGERKVLDDKIERLVGVLDTRDGYVADLIDDTREDNLANVQPKLGLELETAFAVEEQVPRETRPVLAEPARRALGYEPGMSDSQ